MPEAKSDFGGGDRTLTLAVIAPPLIWFAHLTVAYALTPTACASGSRMLLHLTTVVALALLGLMGWLSTRHLRLSGLGSTDRGEARDTRRRFMAMTGVIFAAVFAMAVIANEVPVALLRDCA